MRQLSLCSVLLLAVSTQYGCSPIGMAKRGLTELRGAHGCVYAITEAPAGFFGRLSGVRIGQVSNTIEPLCPPAMQRALAVALRSQAARASDDMEGDGGTCTVDVDITFNKKPGGVVALIGKGALLIGRAGVHDGNAGQVADLIVVVASKAVRTTSDEMVDEFASALIGYIRGGGG